MHVRYQITGEDQCINASQNTHLPALSTFISPFLLIRMMMIIKKTNYVGWMIIIIVTTTMMSLMDMVMIIIIPDFMLFNFPAWADSSSLSRSLRGKIRIFLMVILYIFIIAVTITIIIIIIIINHQVMTRKEMHLTRMMSIIVITFLVLNMPRCIIGLFELTRFVSFGFYCISLFALSFCNIMLRLHPKRQKNLIGDSTLQVRKVPASKNLSKLFLEFCLHVLGKLVQTMEIFCSVWLVTIWRMIHADN